MEETQEREQEREREGEREREKEKEKERPTLRWLLLYELLQNKCKLLIYTSEASQWHFWTPGSMSYLLVSK